MSTIFGKIILYRLTYLPKNIINMFANLQKNSQLKEYTYKSKTDLEQNYYRSFFHKQKLGLHMTWEKTSSKFSSALYVRKLPRKLPWKSFELGSDLKNHAYSKAFK